MRRVADVLAADDGVGETPKRDREAPAGDLGEKDGAGRDLRPGRWAVGLRPPAEVRMGRDDIPEHDVVLATELGEDPVDDRRRRLRGAGSRELPLGRERDAAHSRAAVPRRLADEDDARASARSQVLGQTTAEERRPPVSRIEVVRPADPRAGEPLDERALGRDLRLCNRLLQSLVGYRASGSGRAGAGRPRMTTAGSTASAAAPAAIAVTP